MILPLRLISCFNQYFDNDPKLVNDTNIPVLLICVICLLVAYHKVKTKKYDFSNDEIKLDSEEKIHFQSYDVLMQPKKVYKDFSPTSKGIKPIPYKKTVIGFLIFLFYYLLFTGRI